MLGGKKKAPDKSTGLAFCDFLQKGRNYIFAGLSQPAGPGNRARQTGCPAATRWRLNFESPFPAPEKPRHKPHWTRQCEMGRTEGKSSRREQRRQGQEADLESGLGVKSVRRPKTGGRGDTSSGDRRCGDSPQGSVGWRCVRVRVRFSVKSSSSEEDLGKRKAD